MSDGQIVPIALRRFDTSQPWGFKLQGGSDVGCPIHVAQVSKHTFKRNLIFILQLSMSFHWGLIRIRQQPFFVTNEMKNESDHYNKLTYILMYMYILYVFVQFCYT